MRSDRAPASCHQGRSRDAGPLYPWGDVRAERVQARHSIFLREGLHFDRVGFRCAGDAALSR